MADLNIMPKDEVLEKDQLVGASNKGTMVIDLKDKNAFDTLMASPAHVETMANLNLGR
ncbi:hypothetical protein G5A78_01755 [[Clostridium] scindens]|uniref:hypothetical protein n=2 Tax=Clostridium scindens (strain JCM 10418 / VPI 12708) TaxID=29347 RepID=UPI00138AB86A|nr:hypothetical protein [[Clostridium] scindens]MCB6285705.1 hypothetical protein [[Clostridium] scindens]MCB6423164.1 hypothetical protein [[Clostridium] scindens]NSJ13601.1 hypothetical protein [[Clostridium] scindens]